MSEFVTFSEVRRCALSVIGTETESQITLNTFVVTRCDLRFTESEGHDRALRDAGTEVVHTGPHQTPEQIVETAIQEDAHAIGGAHLTLFPRVIELLARRDANDIVVFGVGIIPADDIAEWETLGVARIFTLGATTASIVGWVPANVPESVA